MFDKFISVLEKEVQKNKLLTAPEALVAYGLDATRIEQIPLAIFFPTNIKQLSNVLNLCSEYKVNVTARGSGTGLSGGAVPKKGSLLISFSKMNKIREVDNENLLTRVEPGVITADLQNKVLKQKLFYPPDPSSASISTIGGNIAEGAGGLRALKYGVTRDYVLGLKVVLSDGEVIKTGGSTYKNVSGFDLTRLMVGSEGSLGLIVEATLKLLPAPNRSLSYLLAFKGLKRASQTVGEIIANGIVPTALEIMDRTTINAVSSSIKLEVPDRAEALLLVEIDGYGLKEQEKLLDKILGGLKPYFIKKAQNNEEAKQFWSARKAALPSLSRLAPSVLLEDVTVVRSNLPALIKGIQKIAKDYGLIIGCFGHAGDGNLHPTIVTDMRDEALVAKAKEAITKIFYLALKLGGTLTGEHGIGIVKKGYLDIEIGKRSKNIMRAIKKSFDNNNILNSDKIF